MAVVEAARKDPGKTLLASQRRRLADKLKPLKLSQVWDAHFPDFAPLPRSTNAEHDLLDDSSANSWANYYHPYSKRPNHRGIRPAMMGLTLTPKRDSVLTAENKDHWDYVLRRMFIQSGSPVKHSIK